MRNILIGLIIALTSVTVMAQKKMSETNADRQNWAIGGGMDFIQRGSGAVPASWTYASNMPTNGFQMDRFATVKNGTCAPTVSQQSAVLRSGAVRPNTMKINWASNPCDYVDIRHRIEATNAYMLIGKTVTLSFWVYFDTTTGLHSTDALHIFDAAPSAVDNWTTQTAVAGGTQIKTYGASAFTAGQWQKISATWTVPATVGGYQTTNGYGFDIYLDWDNSTAVAPNVYVAEVMLNIGDRAAPFALAGGDIQGELAKAQRYYQTSYYGVPVPTNGAVGAIEIPAHSAQFVRTPVFYKVSLRTPAAPVIYSPFDSATGKCREATTNVNVVASYQNNTTSWFSLFMLSGVTANMVESCHWSSDAEL